MKRFKPVFTPPTWLRVRLVSTSAAERFVKRHKIELLRSPVESPVVEIPSYLRTDADNSDEIEVLEVVDTGEEIEGFYADDFAADAEIEGAPL